MDDGTNIKTDLWNPDLSPIDRHERSWNLGHMVKFWISMSITVPSYMIGAMLISGGMNWWQALLTVAIGISVVLIPMLSLGAIGTESGLPFPVLLRMSFGVRGARIAALIRALVACGWFGIFLWIGGKAIYLMLVNSFPTYVNSLLAYGIGLNAIKVVCYIFFLFAHIVILHHGMNAVKKLQSLVAPMLVIMGLLILFWCILQAGSINKIITASYLFQQKGNHGFAELFLPGLGAVIASWIAVAINIADFTRFTCTQRDQVLGQIFGLLPTSILFAFIGIIVTSMTVMAYGHPIWNPIDLLSKFHNVFVLVFVVVGILVATITTNIGANMVPAANDFVNFLPKFIDFKKAGYLVAVIGTLVFPWNILLGVHSYIYHWLLVYVSPVCALGGIMMCDYYLVHKRTIHEDDLFRMEGRYYYRGGWNIAAVASIILAVLPVIPGFLVSVGLLHHRIPDLFVAFYNYGWLVAFCLSGILYWANCKLLNM